MCMCINYFVTHFHKNIWFRWETKSRPISNNKKSCLGQWIARSQNMGSNLDPDLLPKKGSDPIPIQSFPIFHWWSFQIFSDPFRSFPIYQPWVFTIFIIVKIYFDNIFGNWYMSKISMHQNIYHLYLISEKLAQKMKK